MVGAARLVLALAFSGTLVAGAPATQAGAAQTAETPTTVALRFFEAVPPGEVDRALGALRPPVISTDERARLLAALPEEGEVVPEGAERSKLAALAPVLAYHGRDRMLDVKVIDLPHAGIVIYHRAALLVSRPALRLLSAAELQAAVAHEIGHEYFWSEYEDTRLPRSVAGRQMLELKCDGIAVLTLLELGVDVSRLNSAIRKIVDFNEALGVTTDPTSYPTVGERERFVRRLLKMTAGRRK
jgi:hypothetical protein